MKSRILFLGAICAAPCMLAACGGNDNGSSNNTTPTPPPSSNVMQLDTAQVLTLAQASSETSTPFAVNGGAVVLTDTSENSLPIGVNH